MAADEFSMLELLIGLPNIRVLSVEKHDGVLEINLETAVPVGFCTSCGMAGVVKDRPKVRHADLPAFGQNAVLVWHKYRWKCPGENHTWTEERRGIAVRSSSAMTHRAGLWATIQIGTKSDRQNTPNWSKSDWQTHPILAWHTTGASNGPAEGLNSIIKKINRVAAGFKRFDHYRTRILLATGGVNWNLLNPARF